MKTEVSSNYYREPPTTGQTRRRHRLRNAEMPVVPVQPSSILPQPVASSSQNSDPSSNSTDSVKVCIFYQKNCLNFFQLNKLYNEISAGLHALHTQAIQEQHEHNTNHDAKMKFYLEQQRR